MSQNPNRSKRIKTSKGFRIVLLILLIVSTLILTTVNLSGTQFKFFRHQDSYFHILFSFSFFILLTSIISKNKIIKSVLITVTFGLAIEIIQEIFTNGNRHFDVSDVLFNLIGLSLGLIFYIIFRVFTNKKTND